MPRVVPAQARAARRWISPKNPLLTYSLMLRPTDVGYLNQLGRGILSLGLRRLIDEARTQLVARPITRP